MPEFLHSSGSVLKSDPDQRLVWGWASVIKEDGEDVVDSQGDIIKEDVLLDAAHDFIMNARAGKIMHKGEQVADVVESVVFTDDLQKALGIDLGKVGWFFCMKVRDDATWQDMKSGKYPCFSIGGVGEREPIVPKTTNNRSV